MGSLGTTDAWSRLLEALEQEGIRYLIIGMSAAIAQGIVASTLDIDLWIDLPPRKHMRVQNLAVRAGATIAVNTVVYLENGVPVKFVYEVTGLGTFTEEMKHAIQAKLHGRLVPVLSLDRIERSKRAIRRDKDLLHIRLIEDFRRCQQGLRSKQRKPQKHGAG